MRPMRNSRVEGKEYQRISGCGRKPKDFRVALPAIFYVMRTGIQREALPAGFGSSGSNL